jgi:pimeloyl-ACP methyl ester carboxylesterase
MAKSASNTVVILIHGIRTAAWWQSRMAALIAEETGATVIPLKYGYFDTLRFLCPFGICRRGPIDRLRKQIDGIRDEHQGKDIIALAHSYGTYALSRILHDNPHIKFHRIMLCGSIVPEDYDWARVDDQVTMADKRQAIINDCGTQDIWPVLAKSVTWGYGSSGTYGFGAFNVRDRFHALGHSGFFNEDFARTYWIPAINGEAIAFSAEDKKEIPSPGWFDVFRFPFRWAQPVVAAAIVAAGLFLGANRFLQPCATDEVLRLGQCFTSAQLVSVDDLTGRFQSLKRTMAEVLDAKASNLFPPMDQYAFDPTQETWQKILAAAEKVETLAQKGIDDIAQYKKNMFEDQGKVIFVSNTVDIPVDAKYWNAFEEATAQFTGRLTVFGKMRSHSGLPDPEQMRQWREQLTGMHEKLHDALGQLIDKIKV